MGWTHLRVEVSGPGGKSALVKFLVDSGSGYSCLPPVVWKRLDLKPGVMEEFILADGTEVERRVSECDFRLRGLKRRSPVILGERGDEALLGVVTLESMGLILDPFQRRLRRMKLRL